MRILIKENNIEKIKDAIDGIQEKARVRKISPDSICQAVEDIRYKLDIPKKYIDGISVWVDPHAGKFPKAYRGTPESTQFEITFFKGKGYLTSVERTDVKKNRYRFILNETVKEKIIQSYISRIEWDSVK